MQLFQKVPPSTLILALVLSLFVGHGLVFSEDEDPGAEQPAAGGMPGMTPEMLKKLNPGEHHEAMAYLVGDWDVDIKLTLKMEGMPEMPPTTGSATFKWAIPGRWMLQELKATMMGQPYHGVGLHGYDPLVKNHLAAWVHNWDCSLGTVSGTTVDPTGKVKALYGRMNEPSMGEFNKPVKYVMTKISDDKFTTAIWDLGIGGSGQEVFVWTYTRKAK